MASSERFGLSDLFWPWYWHRYRRQLDGHYRLGESSTTTLASVPTPSSRGPLAPAIHETPEETTTHAERPLFCEWKAFNHAGETLVVHDVPEGLADCYRVVGQTLEAWVLAFADAVLYEGSIVESYYDDRRRRIRLQHTYAGEKARFDPDECLEDPVVLLESQPRTDLGDALRPGVGIGTATVGGCRD